MATVYSLIGFGGRTGKSVTTDASTDRVTCTYHGLRNGAAVQFASGTVPSGGSPSALALDTTYYARSYNDNEFTLHTSQAGAQANTGQIIWTGTGTSLFLKSKIIIDYMTSLAGRWGSAGAERVYDGAASWLSGRAGASSYDHEVGEVCESFTDTLTASLVFNIPAAEVTLTTLVNKARSDGWHKGNYPVTNTLTSGYALLGVASASNMVHMVGYRSKIEGLTVLSKNWDNYHFVRLDGPQSSCYNCFVIGIYSSGNGIGFYGPLTTAVNNVVNTATNGVYITDWTKGMTALNNLVTNCGSGFKCDYDAFGFYYNNIAIGNGTNWNAASTARIEGSSNNAGLTGEAWAVGSGTRQTISTTDFVDFANKNFRPYSSSSPQVETGLVPYDAVYSDITDAVRPNYMNGAAEYFDVGAYEFDHGYGLAPVTTTLTLTNLIADSRVHIETQSGSTTYFDQVVSAGATDFVLTVYGDARDDIRIRVRKASAAPYYQPFETLATINSSPSSLYVSQIPDE